MNSALGKMVTIKKIQDQLHFGAMQVYETISLPPFRIYIHPESDAVYANYAIPVEPCGPGLEIVLNNLRKAFKSRHRTARFEYLEDFAPNLSTALIQCSFVEEARNVLMICTPETFSPIPARNNLSFEQVGLDSALDRQHAAYSVQGRAFGGEEVFEVRNEEVHAFFERFNKQKMYLATLNGTSACVASLLPPHQGIAEIAGIGTVASLRRRGVASALVSFILEGAFQEGLEAVFLTAGDHRAGRVYQRVGFQKMGYGLSFVDEAGGGK